MAKVKNKKMLIIGIILATIAVAGIVGVILVNTSQAIGTKLSVMLMPETLEYDDNGETITFYIEENKKYDKTKDEPIEAYNVYYFGKDENGKKKKIVLDGGIYYNAEEQAKQKSIYKEKYEENKGKGNFKQDGAFVTLGFLIKAQEKANSLKVIVSVIVAVYVLVCLAFLIRVWYNSWKKRNYPEDEDNEEEITDSDNSED
ncbi:MAG: hypothetical protein IJS03_07165 [Eubacterium sp.]|nr:hypothetical protein [Eubacterium sp.]